MCSTLAIAINQLIIIDINYHRHLVDSLEFDIKF